MKSATLPSDVQESDLMQPGETVAEVVDAPNHDIPLRPSPVEADIDDDPERDHIPCRVLYILLFVLISLNDGMILGYKSSLTGIFTELKVPSQERSLITLISLTYIIRMFFAPLADKYFVPFIGKRRTYLIPCKIFAFVAYLVGSYFIDEWVEQKRVIMICAFLLFVNCIMVLENNALQGLRLDFFGRKFASSAGASFTIASICGVAIGMQVFTILNSSYAMNKFFNYNQAILTHRGFFMILSLMSLAAIPIQFIIPDIRERRRSTFVGSNPWRVTQAIFKCKQLWNSTLWNFIGPTLSLSMKVVFGQYMIAKGLRREDIVVILAGVLIPVSFVANLVWIPVLKSGNIMLKLWLSVLASVGSQALHSINYMIFDPATNYTQTCIIVGILVGVDTFCNWFMVQSTFYLSTASKKYSVSYISTVNSLFSASRILPLSIISALIDYVNMPILFFVCLALQIAYGIFTYETVREIDTHDCRELGLEFESELEKIEEEKNK